MLHETEPYDGYDSNLGDQRIFDAQLRQNYQAQLAEQPLAEHIPPNEDSDDESSDDETPPLLNRDRVRYESSSDEDSDSEPPPLIPCHGYNSSSDKDSDGEYERNWPTDFQQGDW